MASNSSEADSLDQLIKQRLEAVGEGAFPCDDGSCDPWSEPASHDEARQDYGGVFARLGKRLKDQELQASMERTGAAQLYDELLGLSPERREEALAHDQRYSSFSLAERLLTASAEIGAEDPESSQELAHLSLTIADRLDRYRYGTGLTEDLRARAWAYIGETWRRQGRIDSAQEAFRLAESHLQWGSGDPLEEAEVLALSASLLAHLGDSDQALERLDRSAAIFLQAGERQRLGSVLVRKGSLAGRVGDLEGAIDFLREGVRLLTGSTALREIAEARTDLVGFLHAADRSEEAWTELGKVRSLLDSAGSPLLRERLRWVEGRVASGLGLDDEAESHLVAARTGFLELGCGEEAARVHLDLAALAARQEIRETAPRRDDTSEPDAITRLAREMPRILGAASLRRETLSALMLVQQAAEHRALTPALVREVSRFVEATA